jgi:hypothetical protein
MEAFRTILPIRTAPAPRWIMRALLSAGLVACGLLFGTSAALANAPPPPADAPPVNPGPIKPTIDTTTVVSGLAVALGAAAVGIWFLRRGTRPGG